MLGSFKQAGGGLVLAAVAATGCDANGWFGPDDCEQEAILAAPEWECSAEILAQLEQDREVLYGSSPSDVPSPRLSSLVAHDSCAGGVESTRAAVSFASDLQLRAARVQLLSQRCEPRTQYRTTGSCDYYGDAQVLAPGWEDVAGEAAQGEASQYSTTNTQVVGVDEADFVKNDAQFVYTIAERIASAATPERGQADPTGATSELVIMDVWPAEEAHEIARIALEGSPKKLYLDGDRLLVYASLPQLQNQTPTYDRWGNQYDYGYGYGSECGYGYGCVPTGDGLRTLITIYDVSERAAPRELRQLTLSGSYINSRRIGDVVYTLVQDEMQLLPGTQTAPSDVPVGPDEALAAFSALSAQNRARIEQASPEELLPRIAMRSAVADATAQALECGRVYESPGGAGRGFLSVVSLSLADDALAPHRATIVSEPGFTYASAGALYVAVPQQGAYDYANSQYPGETSVIHKFTLDGLATSYAASGSVEGRVLNQFSMDEYQDHLRVATTSGYAGSADTHSALSVLGQQGAELVTVGKIDDIAPREDIRSARFVQDRGYVVTFEKTDPLYVFDLAEPESPRIAGELKIPGFSTYIHPIDREHLLSIGYDADDQGDFSWFRGIQLQVFNVADMSNPTLLHKTLIGTRGSSSDALDNHLAFNYFAPKRWLALPITVCQGGAASQYGKLEFSGLYLYDVSLESGFNLLGGVNYAPPQTPEGSYDASCSNWWSDASSLVKRSIMLDDYVLSITADELKLNHSADLGRDVAVLPLSR